MLTKKIIILLLLIHFKMISCAQALQLLHKIPAKKLGALYNFLNDETKLSPLKEKELPPPYDFLLTEPLMTISLEKYYSRAAQIKTIDAIKNENENTYSRVIMMVVDGDKARNDIKLALAQREEIVIELALIVINFNELPENIIKGVLNSKVPFGELLVSNHLESLTTELGYFSVNCSAMLLPYFAGNANNKLFGRRNTLVRKDNGKWIAQVVQLLSGSEISRA